MVGRLIQIHDTIHTQAAARSAGASAGLLKGGKQRLVLAKVKKLNEQRMVRLMLRSGRCPSFNAHPHTSSPTPPPSKQAATARLSSSAAIGPAVFTPSDQFEHRHLGPSAEDEKAMLQAIGA